MELSEKYSSLLHEQKENITVETLKIYFDNSVQELNILNDRGEYIKLIDTIVITLLNVNTNYFDHPTILEHPLLIILRDLSVKLLKSKNIFVRRLITLFEKIYSAIDDDYIGGNDDCLSDEELHKKFFVGQVINNNFSKLHTLFSNQNYLNILIHYRIQEEYSDSINQFLAEIMSKLIRRYFPSDPIGLLYPKPKRPYLEEIVTHLCSSAYINTFNHLFERVAQSNQNELDPVESFYLVVCPMYMCFLRGDEVHATMLRTILQKMFQTYVDILTQFTEVIKNCSKIIIEPVMWLMHLLQYTTRLYELHKEFLDISEKLIDILWTIIYELSVKQEPHTHNLLASTIGQLFYGTFQVELLPKIKRLTIISTLTKLLHNGQSESIRLQSCRLLSVIIPSNDIQNQLTNMAHITELILSDIRMNLNHPFQGIRVENTLFCLKNLVENEEVKMELIKQKGLQTLMDCITKRIPDADECYSTLARSPLMLNEAPSPTIYQRALEILLQLLLNSSVCAFIKQNYLFLFDVEKLMSSSEQSLQQVAGIFLDRLETNQNLIDIPVKQIKNGNTTNDLAIFKNDQIFISYSPDDGDLCCQISDSLMNDKIRVNMRLDSLRRLTTEKNLNLIERPKIVLLCISDSYLQHNRYQYDVQGAIEQQFCMIPFIWKFSYKYEEWLQKILLNKILIDFNKFEFECAYNELKTEILRQKDQSKRDFDQLLKRFEYQSQELTILSKTIPADCELSSEITVSPVSIRAVIKSLEDGNWMPKASTTEETFVFIWLDCDIESINYISTIFSKTNEFIRYYTNLEECVSVIQSIVTSKIVVITAIELAENLLTKIDALRCVDSVLIYSKERQNIAFQQDAFKKVIGVFNNFYELKVIIKDTLTKLGEHLEIRRSFNTCKSNKNVLYEFGDFLWLHMFIKVVETAHLTIDQTVSPCTKEVFIGVAKVYYRGNSYMLGIIEKFNKNYQSKDAIRWYTSPHFPHKLLNKALRTENFKLLIPFLFFINDLKQCLANEHEHIAKEKMTVYRGINIPYEEFEKLKKTKGEFISMNGFFSTSRSRKVAEIFSGPTNDGLGYVAVIFHIEYDPFLVGNKFIYADITDLSRYSEEKEVLIDIDTVFRVTNVTQDNDGRWMINMIGSTQFSPVVKAYIERYQAQLCIQQCRYQNGLHIFMSLLEDRDSYEQAQVQLEQLLEKPNGKEIAEIYTKIARTDKPCEEHEILLLKHYNYTRDYLSMQDFKRTARTLNKIGFFLPRNEQLHKYSEISKIWNTTENQSSELTLIENVATVFPYLGDSFRKWKSSGTSF